MLSYLPLLYWLESCIRLLRSLAGKDAGAIGFYTI
jgi:hypothetical protein